jgi:hypothetical protein
MLNKGTQVDWDDPCSTIILANTSQNRRNEKISLGSKKKEFYIYLLVSYSVSEAIQVGRECMGALNYC